MTALCPTVATQISLFGFRWPH